MLVDSTTVGLLSQLDRIYSLYCAQCVCRIVCNVPSCNQTLAMRILCAPCNVIVFHESTYKPTDGPIDSSVTGPMSMLKCGRVDCSVFAPTLSHSMQN